MDQILVKSDIKKREFYFVDGHYFVLINEKQNAKNHFCVFCDELCDKARAYADKNTPELNLSKEKADSIFKPRTEYWTRLFKIGLWIELEKNNKITVMNHQK